MFTGIIEHLGKVREIKLNGREAVLDIHMPKSWKLKTGESIAVNGVCLSVRDASNGSVSFDCMPETLRRSALSELKPGSPINLERSLTLSDRFGGHFVEGHVDGVGVIRSMVSEGNSKMVRVDGLKSLSRFFAEKGSVAVDGVSLTIVKPFPDGFSVALIPLTLKGTTLGRKRVGDRVNIEVDKIVKIVDRLLEVRKR